MNLPGGRRRFPSPPSPSPFSPTTAAGTSGQDEELTSIYVSYDQAVILEQIGEELLRQRDDRAPAVLALVLQYRMFAPKSNVVELQSYSRKVFACDVDESGGLA
jgi:hypothetical protein